MSNPTTTVVNIRQDAYDVYIGRPGRGETGYFGNPFSIGPDGTREEVLAKYQTYFLERMYTDGEFNRRVLALKGKRLGCFCAPARCHGDIIVDWIDNGEPTPQVAPPEVEFQDDPDVFAEVMGLAKDEVTAEV